MNLYRADKSVIWNCIWTLLFSVIWFISVVWIYFPIKELLISVKDTNIPILMAVYMLVNIFIGMILIQVFVMPTIKRSNGNHN